MRAQRGVQSVTGVGHKETVSGYPSGNTVKETNQWLWLVFMKFMKVSEK
jgi:hypothetical protein